MNKGDLEKFKSKLSKFCLFSAEHSFLSILILIFIALLIGGWLFYQYSILTQKAEPQITKQTIQFKENLYQEILDQWQDREEKFKAAGEKEHLDIFR